MTSPTAPTDPRIEEPAQPGTSATYLGGRPYYQYLMSFVVAGIFLYACYAALAAILLPNTVQTIEFQRLFSGTSITSIDQLTALTDLANKVNTGTATATTEQEHLLDLLKQYEAGRASAISTMMAVGSLFTLFAQPVVGVLSDRWRSRWGRRAFWIVAGAVGGALFMIGLRYSTTVLMLTVFWTVAQVSLNFMQAPLSTTVADRVPSERTGTVSGMSGIGMMAGFTGGTVVAGILMNSLGLNTYFVFAVGVVVGSLVFVTFAKDRSSRELELTPFDWMGFLKGFGIPLRDHDFRWVWIARFMMFFGYTAVTNYNLYIIQSHLQPARTAAEANTIVAGLSMAALPVQLVMLALAGKLSDKVKRRKPFVIGSSLVIALDLVIPVVVPTLPMYYFFFILMAGAYGMYMAVDVALFIDVLPDPASAGRDLGVANVATNIGQMLAPVAAGRLVAATHGYSAIFVTAVIAVAISALAIVPVRKVR